MRKIATVELPPAFGISVMSRLSGFSAEWIRTLEIRGALGRVARVDNRRQFTPENLRMLSEYQTKGRRK